MMTLSISVSFTENPTSQSCIILIGFKFIYQDDSIIVESEKVSEIEGFEKELSLKQRIKNLLLQEGVITVKEIARQLNVGEAVARSRLNEMRNKGDVIKQGDKFAMRYE